MSERTERLTESAFEGGLSHEDQCELLTQLVDALEDERDSLRSELRDLAERAGDLSEHLEVEWYPVDEYRDYPRWDRPWHEEEI